MRSDAADKVACIAEVLFPGNRTLWVNLPENEDKVRGDALERTALPSRTWSCARTLGSALASSNVRNANPLDVPLLSRIMVTASTFDDIEHGEEEHVRPCANLAKLVEIISQTLCRREEEWLAKNRFGKTYSKYHP